MMTTVLLKAYTCDEHVDPRAEYVVVEITPGRAQVILDRMDTVDKLKEGSGEFYCASWWDYSPYWYDWSDEADDLLDGEKPIMLAKPLCTSGQSVRQDATSLKMYPSDGQREAHVNWVGYIKHTTAEMSTASIPRSVFEKIAG